MKTAVKSHLAPLTARPIKLMQHPPRAPQGDATQSWQLNCKVKQREGEREERVEVTEEDNQNEQRAEWHQHDDVWFLFKWNKS